MRCGKLVRLEITDVGHAKDQQSNEPMFIVQIRAEITKTQEERVFTVSQDVREDYYSLVTEYLEKRLKTLTGRRGVNNRLFLNYQKGHCTAQVVVINKFRRIPKDIAKLLDVPNPEEHAGKLIMSRRSNFSLHK